MNDYKIQMKDVHKSFGSKHILRGIDLNVEKGTSMVIIGGSGTGKSMVSRQQHIMKKNAII